MIFSTYNQWIKSNYSFDWKVKWFALEESHEEFWFTMLSLAVYYNSGGKIKLSSTNIQGFTKRILSPIELAAISAAEKSSFFKTLLDKVEVFDDIHNPTGIKRKVDETFLSPEIGKWDTEDYKGKPHIKNYRQLSDDLYIFIVTDNNNLLQEERNAFTDGMMNKAQTMEFYSMTYALNVFCKRYNGIAVDIQQQAADSESQIFTNRGSLIEKKLEPSLDSIGDSRKTPRNWDVGLGLFNPIRYEIDTIEGLDIRAKSLNYGKSFRRLLFLKDRLGGKEGSRLNLFFEGFTPYFEEMNISKFYRENPDELTKIPTYKL